METDVAFGTPVPPVPPLLAQELRFTTWFNRENPVVPDDLRPFTEGTHVYATKQVPSVLALCRTRNSTLRKKLTEAVRTGISVEYQDVTGELMPKHELLPDTNIGLMTHNVSIFDSTLGEYVLEKTWKEEIPLPGSSYETPKHFSCRPVYEDPFAVIAGRTLMALQGKQAPDTIVWPGDGFRLSDKIPAYCLNEEIGGRKITNSFRFHDIPQVAQKMHLILEHTFWGRKLSKLTRERAPPDADEKLKKQIVQIRHWATVLVQRLNHLLQGWGDPLWSRKARSEIYADATARSSKHRAKRLIELLKTVDGIFIQRYMSVPEEKWTWHTYDLFTLKNLSALIGDEFYDGEIREKYHDLTTRYAELKKLRKRFKDLSNRDRLKNFLSAKEEMQELIPRWLNDWLPIWRYTRCFEKPFSLAQVDGLLSQTRAAGTPPDLVKMQSKRKFISTVSKAPSPLDSTEKALIRAAISTFDENLDPSVFTGLDTKARITVTISSCWEKTQEEGGTIEAISDIVHMGAIGKKVPKRDLFTGVILEEISYSNEDTGTYIFWACLDEVLKSSPDEINMAALVMVSEPGKARTVTKATAALKVVLDVVNKICSWPLTKIESSASGMAKASHAWNSFKRSFTDQGREVSFAPQNVEVETASDGERLKTITYRDVHMSSTDYENATDGMIHEVASMLSRYWMKRCGIPPILQMIVLKTCYTPRPIVFEGRGPMASYGEKWERSSPFDHPRFIMLRRGVLMGDPLTKPVLHLVNILVRVMGENFSTGEFQGKIFGFSGPTVAEEIRLRMSGDGPTYVVTGEANSSSEAEGSVPPEAGPSVPTQGPLSALLERFPVDPTIVDPVMTLPATTSLRVLQVTGTRTVEINPSLTWNWLSSRKEFPKEAPRDPYPTVQGVNRNFSFKDAYVRGAIDAADNRRRIESLLHHDRMMRQRYEEMFRDVQIIPRQTAVPANRAVQQNRAYSTANYRAASAEAVRSAQRNDDAPSCSVGLLRLLGILPQ